MNLVNINRLREIAEVEFANIVADAFAPGANRLRVILSDGSFIGVWFSLKLMNQYGFHWERRAVDGTIYRHDNAPHKRWQFVKTFPNHFHDGSETNVVESDLSQVPEEALRQFLTFAQNKLSS